MDRVERIKNTKLKFHKIYISFFLPVGVVGNFMLLIQSFSLAKGEPTLLNILGVVERVVFLSLAMIAMKGLTWFRRKGLVSVFVLQASSIAMSAFMVYVSLLDAATRLYAASYALSIALSVFLISYYWKRRKLFSKYGISPEEMMMLVKPFGGVFQDQMDDEEEYVPEEEVEESPVEEIGEYDCPKCGRHITDGAVFCPKCGAQTRTVRR